VEGGQHWYRLLIDYDYYDYDYDYDYEVVCHRRTAGATMPNKVK